jgi:hypothetical protein
MQISVDTSTHTPRQIRAAAKMLQALAAFMESGTADLDLPPIVVDSNGSGSDYPRNAFANTTTSNVVPFPPPTAPAPVRSANDVFGVPSAPPPVALANAVPTNPVGAAGNNPYPPPYVPTYPPIPGEATTAVAPTVATVPAGTAVNGAPVVPPPAFDKTGLPWDARIHSAGANRINESDGTWRKKRGVSDQMMATVEAELRARSGAVPSAPVAAPVPLPPVNPVPVPPPPAFVPGTVPGAPVAAPSVPLAEPPAPTVDTVPAAPASNGPTFMQLMTQANRYCAEQRYSMQQLTVDCHKAGVTLEQLPANPQACALVWNNMETSVGPPRA